MVLPIALWFLQIVIIANITVTIPVHKSAHSPIEVGTVIILIYNKRKLSAEEGQLSKVLQLESSRTGTGNPSISHLWI